MPLQKQYDICSILCFVYILIYIRQKNNKTIIFPIVMTSVNQSTELILVTLS